MGNLPPRKAANINVSPVGNQGNAGQSGILPETRSAQPFGSVDAGSVLPTRSAGLTPGGQPINDDDAGNGTGNVRNQGPQSAMPLWVQGAD